MALAEQVQEGTGGPSNWPMSTRATRDLTPSKPRKGMAGALRWVSYPMAKRGFVLLPRRWVVQPSFAWAARFRRLARDYERLDTTLNGLHLLAFHPHAPQPGKTLN